MKLSKIQSNLLFFIIISSSAQVIAKDITIFYTNDLHAHVNPYKDPAVSKERAVGGFANIAGVVKQEEKTNKDVFFFDAGDYFTGPYISTMTKGEAIIDIMNTMPYDAVSVGNHEFDHGVDNFKTQLSKANFPILLGNIFYTQTGKPVWNKPYMIVEKNGVKIGVIGVHGKFAFYDTVAAAMRQGIEAKDELPFIREGVKALKGNVDLIVLLIHEGVPGRQSSYGAKDVQRLLQADIDTAQKVDGIDVLITGHAHVGTPEPIKVNNTLIVSTDAYGIDMGKLVLDYNKKEKKIEGYKFNLITMYADTYKPDPTVQAKIDEWTKKLDKITQKVVGQTTDIFSRSYGESSPVGNLVNDAVKSGSPGSIASFSNSGGFRADFPKGNLSLADLIGTFPFVNEIITMDVAGKDLKVMANHGANLTNGIIQVSKNVSIKYNSTNPVDHRIISFTIDGKPVQDDKYYNIAVDSFMAAGGDGYLSLKNGKNRKTLPGVQEMDLLVSYIKAQKTISPDYTKRVQDVAAVN